MRQRSYTYIGPFVLCGMPYAFRISRGKRGKPLVEWHFYHHVDGHLPDRVGWRECRLKDSLAHIRACEEREYGEELDSFNTVVVALHTFLKNRIKGGAISA